MFIVNFFSFFWWLIVATVGVGSLKAIENGDLRGVVILIGCVALWKWRRILEFVQDREWRDW